MYTAGLALLICTSASLLQADSRRSYAELEPAHAGQKILIVAPHVDDEALAAGGYASDAIARGAEVSIVYMTAGDHSRTALTANRLTFFATAWMNRKGERRMHEAQNAAKRLGISLDHLYLLGYPDRGLKKMMRHPDRVIRSASTGKRVVPYEEAVSPGAEYRIDNLYRDFQQVVDEVQPDLVIAPLQQDHHPDHRATALIVDHVLSMRPRTVERLGYLIHSWFYTEHPLENHYSLQPPPAMRAQDWLVYPLSRDTVMQKGQVLAAYRSQRRSPYLRRMFSAFSGGHEIFLRVGG